MEEDLDTKEKSLKEELKELKEMIVDNEKNKGIKTKPFKLPGRAKLRNSDLKRGYVTVLVINENDAIDIRKEPIIESTIKLEDTYHSVEGNDLLSYKGKPFVIIPKIKKSPFNPNYGKNETFGQKHIKSRIINETIQQKKKIGGMPIAIGALIIGGIILYALLTG